MAQGSTQVRDRSSIKKKKTEVRDLVKHARPHTHTHRLLISLTFLSLLKKKKSRLKMEMDIWMIMINYGCAPPNTTRSCIS